MAKQVQVPEYTLQEWVELDPRTTAVIVVDMQNDFVKEGGKLRVPTAEATIPAIARLLEKARAAGATVFYTQDLH